ncbi:MAG: hypothetical protein QGI09_10395 [Dehalococcoidia bacterium]|jgi:hypothetical protein|nr:hypothetical protein [Dehalococcoidia bacterium]|tara:strand:+ start:6805 stop:7101 length:297 start_codon:yes stop_codon:yes gene_type:complete
MLDESLIYNQLLEQGKLLAALDERTQGLPHLTTCVARMGERLEDHITRTDARAQLLLDAANGHSLTRRGRAAVYGGGISVVTVVGIIVVAVGKALGLV